MFPPYICLKWLGNNVLEPAGGVYETCKIEMQCFRTLFGLQSRVDRGRNLMMALSRQMRSQEKTGFSHMCIVATFYSDGVWLAPIYDLMVDDAQVTITVPPPPLVSIIPSPQNMIPVAINLSSALQRKRRRKKKEILRMKMETSCVMRCMVAVPPSSWAKVAWLLRPNFVVETSPPPALPQPPQHSLSCRLSSSRLGH